MKALTLWQPWAYAITHLGKRVENRMRRPPADLHGQWLAIHAGKKVSEIAIEHLIFQRALPNGFNRSVLERGSVVALVRVGGCVTDPIRLPPHQLRWWDGPVGWLLSDVRAIDPIPCRGAQGLWDLPVDVERMVARSLA